MHFASLSSEAGLYFNLIIFISIASVRAKEDNNHHYHHQHNTEEANRKAVVRVIIIVIYLEQTPKHVSVLTENKKNFFCWSVDFNCMTSVLCTSSRLNTLKNSKDCPWWVCLYTMYVQFCTYFFFAFFLCHTMCVCW